MAHTMIVKLHVVHGRPAGKTLRFGPGDYYLGRGPECQVRFNSDWVSRQHCVLRVTGEGALLRDLGSRNGTLVNGRLCEEERSLNTGDLIQVGPIVFRIAFEPATEPLVLHSDSSPTLLPEGGSGTRPSATDSTAQRPPLRLPEEE